MARHESNVFAGDPRPEHDAAWRRLIEPMTIKISSSDLNAIDSDSIAVYREPHCVKRIRRYFHLEKYYPNKRDEERRKEDAHVDHCLKYWREAAMCRGDTALSTFRWGDDGAPYSRVQGDHECVDWQRLDDWARGRMVNMSHLENFIH